MLLVELNDEDFVAMLRGDAFVRRGIAQPPGGVDEPDVLRHVRRLAARLHDGGYAGGHWMMVAEAEAVGLCGIKAPPCPGGEIEIGYGVAASRRRRGHASAAVRLLIEAVRSDDAVRSIVATTLVDNTASQHVLARNGFARAAELTRTEDGDIAIVWRLRV